MGRLRELLIKHEGITLKVYTDSVGKRTIGVGRNLDDQGISELEAMALLRTDMDRVQLEAGNTFPWFFSLGAARQDAILSMIFNMGLSKFQEFQKMIAALAAKDFDRAAEEMLASKWASQVGQRAQDLASMMRSGTYLTVL